MTAVHRPHVTKRSVVRAIRVLAMLLVGTACTRACGPIVLDKPEDVEGESSTEGGAGEIRGRILVLDTRSGSPAFGGNRSLPKALVAVTAVPDDPDGGTSYVNPTCFAVTDESGRFGATWIDETGQGAPMNLRITTFLQSSEFGGGIIPPPITFRVAHASGGEPQSTTFRVVDDLNVQLADIVLPGDDDTAAYLTTREMFDRIVKFSRVLRERMPGLVVKTGMSGLVPALGFAPTVHEVQIAPGIPQSSPLALAHEIGHTFTWAALDLDNAPLNPASDYGWDFYWDLDTPEPSKAAFLEGMAETWAMVWGFGSNPNATTTSADGTKTYDFEFARVSLNGAVVLDCAKATNSHEFPFCHAAALRDLIDDDGAQGDGVDLTLAFLVNVLDRFPDGCGDNGCRDEGGWDALNHLDFLRNCPTANQAQVLGVFRGNGVDGGN